MSLTPVVNAVAFCKSGDKEGVVTFQQMLEGGPTIIEATFKNLGTARYTLHIHEYGDITSLNATGGFFAPIRKANTANSIESNPELVIEHVGNLGELVAVEPISTTVPTSVDDVAKNTLHTLQIVDKRVSLIGPTSVIGRSVVVHQDEGESHSVRVMAGVIGIAP